jgi:hypothetical protein
MRDLRTNIERAKAGYESVRYPGDLAAELLPARRKMGWVIWAIPAAVAAMVAVAMWPGHPSQPAAKMPGPISHVMPDRASPVDPATRPTLPDLAGLKPSIYLTQMRTGVEGAMSQLTNGVDAALEAPAVTESVATVKQVAGEIGDLASVTWSQIKPRGPGC